MITFNLLTNPKNVWKVHLKSNEEMVDIFYENEEQTSGESFFGITEYQTSTVYINKDINGFLLIKALRHELMHIYLWEIDKNGTVYSNDEVCEIMSEVAPLICQKAEEIALKVKEK